MYKPTCNNTKKKLLSSFKFLLLNGNLFMYALFIREAVVPGTLFEITKACPAILSLVSLIRKKDMVTENQELDNLKD